MKLSLATRFKLCLPSHPSWWSCNLAPADCPLEAWKPDEVLGRRQVPGGRRGKECWLYKGGYWEARESGKWEGCRDIYGPGPKGLKPAQLLL